MTTIPITKAVDMSTELLDEITDTLDADGYNTGYIDRYDCDAEDLTLEQIEELTMEVLDAMIGDRRENYPAEILAEADRLNLNAKEQTILAEIINNRW